MQNVANTQAPTRNDASFVCGSEATTRDEQLSEKRAERKEGRVARRGTRLCKSIIFDLFFLLYLISNWPVTCIVREVVRDGDASDNAAGVAGRADNTPAGTAAMERASKRDWLASPGRIADSYDPSYPPPSVDPLSWR